MVEVSTSGKYLSPNPRYIRHAILHKPKKLEIENSGVLVRPRAIVHTRRRDQTVYQRGQHLVPLGLLPSLLAAAPV